ncbi:MAG: ATP-binding protein [Hyphomonadaceae bacterium]|nr:ATP-binding protein [Hyphomonadaceae bacterium]
MSNVPETPEEQSAPLARRLAPRVRDLCVMAALCVGVVFLLALSGALGWVEAITASIVMIAAAMAYYVGSSAPDPVKQDLEHSSQALVVDAPGAALPALLDALPVPALFIGLDQRIHAANSAARGLFRIRGEQNSLAASVIRNPALLSGLDIALSPMGAASNVEVVLGSASDQLWLAHIAPFNVGAGGALIVMEDHTALRRAEKARADFLANASHELRTPLTSLAGFIETMRGPARNDPESWGRFLDIMFNQTERMKRLIADLLSLSRIEFSEHRPPQTVEDIPDLVGMTVAALRPVAFEREIELVRTGPETGLRAVADADEVTQVAQNLVVNAVKYSPERSRVVISCGIESSMEAAEAKAGRQWGNVGRITVLQASQRGPVPGIWLRVEDEGPGIDREHLPRLGQRFYRVDESRGGDVGGTGLGLAIVKHIMTRHRGGFVVESEPEHGSAFGVWFPALEYTPLATEPGKDAEDPGEPRQVPRDALAKSL